MVGLPLSGWRIELEITGRCQLNCVHCYADSGPTGDQGTMTADDWSTLITEAAAAGASGIQFIGGEPTLHPQFTELLQHAIGTALKVEVFSNLVHVREEWWELFGYPNVSLAFSYYSDHTAEHSAITGRANSHARTKENVAEAVRRGIALRAGIVEIVDGQRVRQARAELAAMGVMNARIDRVRGAGRETLARPDVSQLCGGCGINKAAIGTNGDVWPCVLSRFMVAGNVKATPLAEILYGRRWRELVASVPVKRSGCNPDSDGNDCSPAETLVDPY
ncbi:radical SAM/SPASM domain-containing protein [Sphaerisporangium album]|uniref:Radical SAM/SPASM domain-containing protein n=2 Tax=Sphaerisporangium album TaxID=509200 RepID=A0A367FLC8_9ACTN|nr:radical SAM/SPASM domain-containing protein [Sphaerisporangium album]